MWFAQTLCSLKQEVFFMKTSNLVALMIALIISFGGVVGIDILFNEAYAHAHATHVRMLQA
jgi:hypothetical protein